MATQSIDTLRLQLRPLAVSDAAGLFPTLSHPEVMRWTPRAPLSSIPEAEEWIRDHVHKEKSFNFGVHLRSNNDDGNDQQSECIGVMGSHALPQIGYLIHPDHAGQGHATEALRALLPALFGFMARADSTGNVDAGSEHSTTARAGYDYVEARVDSQNMPSLRVLKKCGFVVHEERPLEKDRVLVVHRLARPGTSLKDSHA